MSATSLASTSWPRIRGADSPFDPEKGPGYIRASIADVEGIGLSAREQDAIFSGNVTRLLGLEGDPRAS